MGKNLTFGYGLSVAALVAMLALVRGAIPKLDGLTAFFYSSLLGLLLLVAAVLCFLGARSSTGHIRKYSAYLVSALSFFIGLGSLAAVIIVVIGSAKMD